MKRVISQFVTIIAVLGALCASAAAKPTLKVGTLAPQGSPWHEIIRDMANTWKQESGGKLDVKIYAGGVAGDERDMVRKMRVGQLQGAMLTGVGLSAIAPEVMALQMPMMLASYEELDYVFERIAPKLEKILEAKGFKVLNWGDAGWVHFFAAQPVVSPADLKKRKLFVWAGEPLYVELFKDAGYKPVPLAATEIHTGLASGLIDAFSTTPLAALSFQWFGAAKHMTDLKWAPLVGATVITTAAWAKIPEPMQAKVLEAARSAGVRMKKDTRGFGDKAIATMKKHGLVVHAVPAPVHAEWEKAALAAYPKLMKVIPAGMVDEVRKYRDEYRASKKTK